jgi:hypothetical protein
MGLLSAPRKASIDIDTSTYHILDDIIVTLTIVANEAEQDRNARPA